MELFWLVIVGFVLGVWAHHGFMKRLEKVRKDREEEQQDD